MMTVEYDSPIASIPVLADLDKIGQVIINLLRNAIKYSLQAGTISVTCITIDGFARVDVKDEGIGAAAEHLERLFDRHYRVDNPNTKFVAGFGIGLYLCREIIERQQGIISAKSEPGKGSTFYLT